MDDPFKGQGTGLTSPAVNAAAVTPNDSADLAVTPRALYLGASGNLAVVMQGGQTVTFIALAAGVPHPLRARRVLATGTTATGIIAVW